VSQILVRNLDDAAVERLKSRARAHGRSLQAEAKDILEQSARFDVAEARKLVDCIRRSFEGRKFDDSTELVREDRNR
jgi:plasmid stability protein